MCDSLAHVLPESLRKRVTAMRDRISQAQTARAKVAAAFLIEQAVEKVEPLLSALEKDATVKELRGAALRAALNDTGWKPEQLKAALGHKSPSSVTRYLAGEEAIPDRIYAIPEIGPAFYERVGQMFGVEKKKVG